MASHRGVAGLGGPARDGEGSKNKQEWEAIAIPDLMGQEEGRWGLEAVWAVAVQDACMSQGRLETQNQ